jgi:hypothetical protein
MMIVQSIQSIQSMCQLTVRLTWKDNWIGAYMARWHGKLTRKVMTWSVDRASG